jgi:CheY-like chemotaxis protein
LKKINITVADDDLDDHQLIRDAVRELQLPCDVNSVYNGLQLMDYLQREQAYINAECPDFILLDLNMPLMNGFEALQKIRENEQLRHLPVYVLSTSKSAYDMERALEYGATGYYSKSIMFNDLKKLIQSVCSELESKAQ